VVLVGLDEIEVLALALRETVVTVEEELSGPNAVSGTGTTENVSSSETRSNGTNDGTSGGLKVAPTDTSLGDELVSIASLATIEKASVGETGNSGGGRRNRVESILTSGVVVDSLNSLEGNLSGEVSPLVDTVVNGIRTLDNPDELLAGVVEVEAGLVA
jgi:hypothetical protein